MKSTIYEYLDYQRFLSDWIDSRSKSGRGERSKIANVLKCHIAYLSRILAGKAHLSLEQAQQLAPYLGLTDEETDFFLLLVLHARAGTKDLQNYYLSKIKSEVERKNVLLNRLQYRKTLPEVEQATYFSAWYYAAIHLLISIPEFQTKEQLERHLKISPKKITQVLNFLVASGLAVEKKGKYQTGTTNLHLGNNSPMISKHHLNWRLQALQSIERERAEELHYSSAITIPREAVPKIRLTLVKAIEEVRKLTKSPNEEVLYCYAIDFFEVGGRES